MVAHGDVSAMDAPIINGDVVNGDASGGVADAPGADGFASISWQGQSGSTVTGTFGTLTVGTDGTYSYDLNDTNATVVALADGVTVDDVFTYTIVDGDGDTSTTTLTITITGANDGPTITGDPAEIRVSEEGLPGGNQDTVGNQDTTNSDTGGSTVTASDPDGDTLIYTLSAPVTALASNLVAITWTGDGTNTLVGKAGATTIITISIDGSGVISVDLDGPLDHPTITEEDDLSFLVGVTVADGNGKDDTTTVTITVEDDSPLDIIAMPALVANSGDAVGSGDLNFLGTVGADEPGDVVFSTDGHVDGEALTDTGDNPLTTDSTDKFAILLAGFGTHVLTGWADVDGSGTINPGPDTMVFTIELDPVGDDYTITFFDTIDDGSGLDFSNLTNVASGKNDFLNVEGEDLGLGDPDFDLVITALDLSDGVNTSKALPGGAVGVGAQNIVPLEGVRLDFVDDASGNEKNLVNLDYDAHTLINGAFFQIAQFQKGTLADVTVTIWDVDDKFGNQFASGAETEVPIEISSIKVNGVLVWDSVNGDADAGDGITVMITDTGSVGNIAEITGLTEGSIVQVFGSTMYDRIEVENTSTETKFDIGNFGTGTTLEGSPVVMDFDLTVTDADGDAADGTLTVATLPDGGATITGDGTDEALIGGSGGDTLDGAGGDDILTGGGGADSLTGGTGADTFVYLATSDGVDTITDFDVVGGGTADDDVLELSDLFTDGTVNSGNVDTFVQVSSGTLSVDPAGTSTFSTTLANLTGVSGGDILQVSIDGEDLTVTAS